MKRMLAIVLAMTMCLSMAACGGKEAPAPAAPVTPPAPAAPTEVSQAPVTPASKDVEYEEWAVTRYSAALPTADPYGATSMQTAQTTNTTHNTVVHLNMDAGIVEPELAHKWEPNADNTEWTFYLEKDVTFHNGNKFTAEDVKFTWEYTAEGAGNVLLTNTAAGFVDKIEVIDDYTIKFVLKDPMPDFDCYLFIKVLDKESYETMPAAEAALNGTGPYHFNTAESVDGSHWVVTRYDGYWQGIDNYPTKNIKWKIIKDNNATAAALENGEVDFCCPASATIPLLEGNSKLEVGVRPGSEIYFLGFNYANPLFQDPAIRKAFAQAINKEDVSNIGFANGLGGTPHYSLVVPSATGYTDQVDVIEYNPEEARKVLEPLNLELTLYHYTSGAVAKACETIQSDLEAVGVKVNIEQKETANLTKLLFTHEGYDLYVQKFAYKGAMMYMLDRHLKSDGSQNYGGYKSEEYDKFSESIAACTNFDDMKKEFANLQQWLIDNNPLVPLVNGTVQMGRQLDVEGVFWSAATDMHDWSTVRIPKRG